MCIVCQCRWGSWIMCLFIYSNPTPHSLSTFNSTSLLTSWNSKPSFPPQTFDPGWVEKSLIHECFFEHTTGIMYCLLCTQDKSIDRLGHTVRVCKLARPMWCCAGLRRSRRTLIPLGLLPTLWNWFSADLHWEEAPWCTTHTLHQHTTYRNIDEKFSNVMLH